jgi:hypothetical protein
MAMLPAASFFANVASSDSLVAMGSEAGSPLRIRASGSRRIISSRIAGCQRASHAASAWRD